jgi:hypothetical protein
MLRGTIPTGNLLTRIALLTLGALLTACAAPPGPRFTDADYPGTVLPASALPVDVLWQQRVTATWGEGSQRGFDAAIQKQGDLLTVLGLSPVGSVGFAFLVRGEQVELRNDTDKGGEAQIDLPFPPRFVVLDVQRTFYPWFEEAPPVEGERERTVDGERVREVWHGGRLAQRRFERIDAQPPGVITITYDWTDTDPSWLAPRHTLLDNGWFGYQLTVDTHAETRLPASPR